MNQWLKQHLQPLKMVLGRMRQNLLGTVLICCVMGVTLSLPEILYTIVDNLSHVAGNIEGKPQLSLFLKLDIPNSAKEKIVDKLKKHPDIKSYEF
ncbi:MAG: ABC transporter permease, partial [Actinomycetales bacterium]